MLILKCQQQKNIFRHAENLSIQNYRLHKPGPPGAPGLKTLGPGGGAGTGGGKTPPPTTTSGPPTKSGPQLVAPKHKRTPTLSIIRFFFIDFFFIYDTLRASKV